MSTLLSSVSIRLGNAVPEDIAVRLGTNSSVARMLRPLVNRIVPDSPQQIVVRAGLAKDLKLFIKARQEKFYWTGTYETHVQEMLVSTLKPGMTMWDIGAHVGFFALLGARLVGDRGRVHAFEPLPQNRGRLRQAMELNQITNLTLHDEALSSTNGTSVLHAHGSTSMWTLDGNRGANHGIKVNCRTLDDLAGALEVPDLIKIDAEGFEVEVLRGGKELLSAQRPRLIVEFSNEALLAEAQALLSNYEFRDLGGGHWFLH